MTDAPSQPRNILTARALLLGDRIDTIGLERSDMLSTQPLAFVTQPAGCPGEMAEEGFTALETPAASVCSVEKLPVLSWRLLK